MNVFIDSGAKAFKKDANTGYLGLLLSLIPMFCIADLKVLIFWHQNHLFFSMLIILNEHWFRSVPEARQKIEAWRWQYNNLRPHSSLQNKTPSEFAKEHREEKLA